MGGWGRPIHRACMCLCARVLVCLCARVLRACGQACGQRCVRVAGLGKWLCEWPCGPMHMSVHMRENRRSCVCIEDGPVLVKHGAHAETPPQDQRCGWVGSGHARMWMFGPAQAGGPSCRLFFVCASSPPAHQRIATRGLRQGGPKQRKWGASHEACSHMPAAMLTTFCNFAAPVSWLALLLLLAS